MKTKTKIVVQGSEIAVFKSEKQDYISLTDMVKGIENGLALIEKWLRNKNTIEFLGIWEEIYNPNFNSPEFEGIKNQAGTNWFVPSVKQWVTKTNSIGIIAKTGRYGGTCAHKDIAFEFASWVSPSFKIYLIKEFQRLKDLEQKQLDWRAKDMVNYFRYGTNDETEIWLMRCGFSIEEVELIKDYVSRIDENEILFSSSLNEPQNDAVKKLVERYL